MIDTNEQPDAVIEPAPPPAPPSPTVATVPRETLNYVVIAVVFLVLGLVIGVIGYDRISTQSAANTDALIQRAVATAVAAVPNAGAAVAAAPSGPIDVNIEGAPTKGSPDAPIVMVEFGDFQCSFCKRFFDTTLDPLLEQYGDQIYFVYRDFPVLGPASLDAALAAACAQDQDAFWEYHDILYANPQALTREDLIRYAQSLNLDMEAFTTCYDNEVHREAVIADYVDGQNYGVGGTPTFFINGRIFVGAQPLEQFEMAIESELAALTQEETTG